MSNLNLLLLIGLLIMIVIIVFFVLSKVKTMKGMFKPLYYKASHEWSLLVCYLCLVPIAVFGMIQFANSDFSNGIFGTSFIVTIICFILLLASIGYGGFIVSRNKQKLYDPLFQYQNGFLYCSFKQKIPQIFVFILSTVIFLIVSIIIGIDFEKASYTVGIWSLFVFSLIYMIMIVALFPFKIKLINILEIISALFLMLAFMFLLISIYFTDKVRTCSNMGFFFDIMFPIFALLFILSTLGAALFYFLKHNNKKTVYEDNLSFDAYRIKFDKTGEIDATNLLFMKNGMYTNTNVDKKIDLASKEQLLPLNKNSENVHKEKITEIKKITNTTTTNIQKNINLKENNMENVNTVTNKTTTKIKKISENQNLTNQTQNDQTKEIDNTQKVKMQSSLNKQEIIQNNESRKFRDDQKIKINQDKLFNQGSFGIENNLKEIPESKSIEQNYIPKQKQIRNTFGNDIDNLKEENMIKINTNEKTLQIKQDIDDQELNIKPLQPESEDDYNSRYQSSYNQNFSSLHNNNYNNHEKTPHLERESENSDFKQNIEFNQDINSPKMYQNHIRNNYLTKVEMTDNYQTNDNPRSVNKYLEDVEYDKIKQQVLESKLEFENRDSYPMMVSDNNSSYIGHQYNINNAHGDYLHGRLTNKYNQEQDFSNSNSYANYDQNMRNTYQSLRKKHQLNFDDNDSYNYNTNYQVNKQTR